MIQGNKRSSPFAMTQHNRIKSGISQHGTRTEVNWSTKTNKKTMRIKIKEQAEKRERDQLSYTFIIKIVWHTVVHRCTLYPYGGAYSKKNWCASIYITFHYISRLLPPFFGSALWRRVTQFLSIFYCKIGFTYIIELCWLYPNSKLWK